jgi:hypothetical protein
MASLEPFDPKKHKPIDTVDGNKATEYTTTMESPDGKVWNIPQIWFDEKTKEPKYLAGDKAWDAAAKYEERTKKKFPRFNSIKEGDTAAQERSNAGGATDKSLAYAEGGLNESPSWLDRMQGFFTKEEKDLSLSNVPLFDRPMDATNDDIKIGEDELGNPRYRTMFGAEYTVSLAPDQRSSMGKFKQDVVPAVQDYLEDPSLPTGKQVVDTGKAVAEGIYDTISIPKKLFTGKMGASEVTVGDVLDIAGGAALGSIGFKVPEGSTRMFGGASAKKLDTTNFATAEKRLNEQKALNPDVETDLEANRKIWKETGWFIDPADKRWRFEVDDKAAGFKDLSNNPWIEGKSTYKSNPIAPVSTNAYSATYKVGDVFEHKELYKRYPHLKDFEVTFSDPALDPTLGPNIEGYMNVANKRLVISKEAANSPDGYRAVMLHELQHAVQEYEGFTRGNNPKRINPALLSKVDAEIDALISEANNRAIELRTELNMSGITDAQIKSADFEKLVQDPKLLSAQKELKDLAFNKIPELENSRQNSAYEFYLGTGGEIESRLVEYRRNLDKGNRKISFPLDSRKKLLDSNKIPPDRVGLDDESVTSRPTGSVYSDIRIPVNPKVALDDTVTAEAVKSMLSKNKNTKQVADMKLGDIMKDENGADAWEFSGWTFKEISRRDVVDHGGPSFILDAEPGVKSYKKDPVLIPQAKFKSLDPNAAPHDRIKKVDLDSIIYESDLSTFKPTNTSSFRDKAPLFDRVKDKLGFAQGGAAMRTDNQMKLYALGGMEDDGMEVDPVSGNEIPPGSMAREVRDDIPAQLSDGEYVVPADVVRFFGVKYFEDLRQEAKIGLQRMEQDGRIGGEPVEMAQGLTEGDMAALQEMTRTGVASGGLMDKIAYTAMNDPVVNERLNSYGVPVKFAVGGMAQSQYNNPTEIDQIIQQVGATLQQRPEIMQELAKRGITISRTEADVPAQQMATANSPSQTTEPIMAATGTLVNSPYINPISAATTSTPNTNMNQYSLLPPGFDTFNTLGGSYFTPESYNAPNVPQPVAAPAPVEPVAPITCPPGYLWDAASGTCLPVQNDGGGNDDLEQTKAVSKPWYEGEDFSDPTKYVNSLLTDVTGLGKIAQIAGVFNPAALLVGGVGIGSKVVQNVAKARAMAQVQAALGNTELAKTLTDSIDGYIGKQSGFVKGLEGMGFGSGVNYANSFAKILGFKDLKDAQGTSVRSEIGIDGKPLNKKSNLERFQFQYKDYVTRQAEDNKADKLTTEEIRSVTNQSNRDNDDGVYSPGGVDVASVRDGGSNASERAAVQTSREASAARNEAVQRASNMSGGVTRENVEKAGGSWASGGRAKGGLMVRKK